MGTKLLGLEVRIASRIAWKAARGKQLTRRERAQLTRTTADLFRLVPMVVIIVSTVHTLLEATLPMLLTLPARHGCLLEGGAVVIPFFLYFR